MSTTETEAQVGVEVKKDGETFSKRDEILKKVLFTRPPDGHVQSRLRAKRLLKRFNDYEPPEINPNEKDLAYHGEQTKILAELFNMPLEKAGFVFIEAPLRVDNGTQVEFRGLFYANYGLTILDAGKVTIGKRVIFGPNVQLYAAGHSTDVVERRKLTSYGLPITIGDDVWVCGGVIIIGPCTIGSGVTIAAGSVVKGDIPDNVVVAGSPAKIVKHVATPPPYHSAIDTLFDSMSN